MRFDDMLATVLAQPMTNAAARVAGWRQVVDLLGQRRGTSADPAGDRAYDLLRTVRGEVPAAMRAEAARAIAGRRLPAELVAFFAEEPAPIMAPLVISARLSEGEWLRLMPFLSPVARGILRHRRDLGPAVARGLASFGAADFALDAPAGVAAEPGTIEEPAPVTPPVPDAAPVGDAQIRELVARIDAFRRAPRPAGDEPTEERIATPTDSFRFETAADGLIQWVEGAPREPLIGVSLAAAAEQLDHGVDGQVAGAFRQRARFRDARLSIAGAGPAAGEWRISGVPFFDAGDGRFTGYRGHARRPQVHETAASATAGVGLHGMGLPPDSLRQLVHELRTPLNAVVGFAEMIERQLLGPAGREYRDRAADIIGQGRRLLTTVDDLDLSARIDSERLALDPVSVDAGLLLRRLQPDYAGVARSRGATLEVAIAGDAPAIDADPVALERMFARLLAATVGLAEAGEGFTAALDVDGEGADRRIALRITRPRLLAGRQASALLDPGYGPEGDLPDAPVLGLGFALRLVANLAAAAQGRLDIEARSFVLRLPAHSESALSGNRLA